MRCEAQADPPCDERPAYEFRWDWGTGGVCCATHRIILEQLARDQLNRNISFVPLATATSSPSSSSVEPEESVELIALRKRVAELTEENGRLSAKALGLEHELADMQEGPHADLARPKKK